MTVINTTDPTQRINSAFTDNSTYNQTPVQYYRNELQSKIDSDWSYASDVYTIQEEYPFASGSMLSTEVRINHVPVSATGEKLGDDFKQLIFKNLDHYKGIGYKYYFDENWWITTNADIYKKVTASVIIRRCNNILRWVDENGNYFSEPCAIEYKVQANKDYGRATLVIPEGSINIYAQLNSNSRKISPNQRFLFGNTDQWVCYRIYGDGLRNFLNDQTLDNNSTPLLMLTLGAHYVNNDTDNLSLGVADYYNVLYTLNTNPNSITGNIGDTIQLNTIVKKDGILIDKAVSYSTNNTTVATVTGSMVTLSGSGIATISAKMVDNPSLTNSVGVVVSGSITSLYEVRINPVPNFILEDNSKIFTCYLYLNGALQSDVFNFNIINTGIPDFNYVFSKLDGNTFMVKNNKRWMANALQINCVSGVHSSMIQILLKGVW
jgi:hypothetical protein